MGPNGPIAHCTTGQANGHTSTCKHNRIVLQKNIAKNGCVFYTKNYCSYPHEGELSLSAKQASTPSPQCTCLPSPKTRSIEDTGPCCKRKPGIHKSQAPDLRFLSPTRKRAEDMAFNPCTCGFSKHACTQLASELTIAQGLSFSISFLSADYQCLHLQITLSVYFFFITREII